jgi:hypothetical protein
MENKEDKDGNYLMWGVNAYESWSPVADVCYDCFIELNRTLNEFFGKKLFPEEKDKRGAK